MAMSSSQTTLEMGPPSQSFDEKPEESVELEEEAEWEFYNMRRRRARWKNWYWSEETNKWQKERKKETGGKETECEEEMGPLPLAEMEKHDEDIKQDPAEMKNYKKKTPGAKEVTTVIKKPAAAKVAIVIKKAAAAKKVTTVIKKPAAAARSSK